MSCKTPVITSNLTSIPEVTNDCAVLIDPFNKDELASAILSLLNSPSLLEEYSEKGYKNSLEFTWTKTAKATLNAYKKALSDLTRL